jgi:hypothetical protein
MKTTTKAFKETPQAPMPTLSAAAMNYVKDQEMRLSFLLPVRLHTRFKTVCSARGLKMADEIRVLLERRIEELENGQEKAAAVTQLR